MKILIFSSKYPPEIGGVEEVVKNLSIQFSKKAEVFVITTFLFSNTSSGFFSKLIKGFRVVGKEETKKTIFVKTIFMSLPRSLFGYLSFIYRFPASILAIRKSINKFQPNIINAHFLDDSAYFFYFATLFIGIPLVLDIHGNEIHLFSKSTFYKFFFGKILKKSTKVIVHTEYMKKELLKIYKVDPGKVFIVPNGVDTQRFSAAEKYKSPKYFLYVGRFDTKKGIEVLLKAYKNIESKISTKLIVVGDGKGEVGHGSLSVENLSKEYSSKNITFTGLIDNTLVVEYYKGAYFTVFPSLYEPFGIVAIESVSCGVPFIASSGGFEEIAAKTKAGITFKSKDQNQLEKILLKVDKDPKLRELLHKNALKSKDYYNWASVSEEYFKIISL